jgi:hypothetical protein
MPDNVTSLRGIAGRTFASGRKPVRPIVAAVVALGWVCVLAAEVAAISWLVRATLMAWW